MELYYVIIDCNFNDGKIREKIKEKLKLQKIRGDDFGWNVVDKGKKLKPVETTRGKKEKEHQEVYDNTTGSNFYLFL